MNCYVVHTYIKKVVRLVGELDFHNIIRVNREPVC